jgi:hypothetical protein
VPLEKILHTLVHGQKEPILSDAIQQTATPKHMTHWILNLSKQDLCLCFLSLGD